MKRKSLHKLCDVRFSKAHNRYWLKPEHHQSRDNISDIKAPKPNTLCSQVCISSMIPRLVCPYNQLRGDVVGVDGMRSWRTSLSEAFQPPWLPPWPSSLISFELVYMWISTIQWHHTHHTISSLKSLYPKLPMATGVKIHREWIITGNNCTTDCMNA